MPYLLFVDDDSNILNIHRNYFESRGFSVSVARTAGQAQQRTRELHAVLDERKAFFSDLAHNLKAPVVAIHGFTDLILRGNLYLDDDLREYLDKISSENEELCRRMYVLGDLNAFDRITEPRELIEINALLTQVSRNNEPEACISG